MARRRSYRRARGFTLMEVLLVLVILVILSSFAMTYFSGTLERAGSDAAKTQIGIVESAAQIYHLHMKSYPHSLDDLLTVPSDARNPAKWAGPYLEKRVPLDSWDNEFQYLEPGKQNPHKFDMWSMGPDGIDGTEDDIGNWTTE